mmetsp:Transcript_22578/g.58960  ORF Transcript_22578/g.58960 Transcript_22578/m.58960 type:complete len:247 (+) Transcript_22578:1681-2421(+)
MQGSCRHSIPSELRTIPLPSGRRSRAVRSDGSTRVISLARFSASKSLVRRSESARDSGARLGLLSNDGVRNGDDAAEGMPIEARPGEELDDDHPGRSPSRDSTAGPPSSLRAGRTARIAVGPRRPGLGDPGPVPRLGFFTPPSVGLSGLKSPPKIAEKKPPFGGAGRGVGLAAALRRASRGLRAPSCMGGLPRGSATGRGGAPKGFRRFGMSTSRSYARGAEPWPAACPVSSGDSRGDPSELSWHQ